MKFLAHHIYSTNVLYYHVLDIADCSQFNLQNAYRKKCIEKTFKFLLLARWFAINPEAKEWFLNLQNALKIIDKKTLIEFCADLKSAAFFRTSQTYENRNVAECIHYLCTPMASTLLTYIQSTEFSYFFKTM